MDYKGRGWERLRERILKRDNYQCQVSKRYGKNVQANTVHHIFPVSKYPQYQYCDWNLISVTASVHNTFHYRDSDELTEAGTELLRRTARKQGIKVE